METCDSCGEKINYGKTLYRIDIQQWYLDRAVAAKRVYCASCGPNLMMQLDFEPEVME